MNTEERESRPSTLGANLLDGNESIAHLRRLNAKLKAELFHAYHTVDAWKTKAELLAQRLSEAERLLWPSRFTNSKVKEYFEKQLES